MLEGLTPFAAAVRGRFLFSLGTEYAPDEDARRRIFPVPHCDILKPELPPGSFDLIVSNDVLEHVPDLSGGISGMASLLKPGGVMLAIFPFAYMSEETLIKAVLEDGGIRHLTEPEYHGNPVDPEAGSLVFAIPGWDILDVCIREGFSGAEMIFIAAPEEGIVATELAGVFVLRAVK